MNYHVQNCLTQVTGHDKFCVNHFSATTKVLEHNALAITNPHMERIMFPIAREGSIRVKSHLTVDIFKAFVFTVACCFVTETHVKNTIEFVTLQ